MILNVLGSDKGYTMIRFGGTKHLLCAEIREQLIKVNRSFHSLGPWDRTEFARPGNKSFYPLSHGGLSASIFEKHKWCSYISNTAFISKSRGKPWEKGQRTRTSAVR